MKKCISCGRDSPNNEFINAKGIIVKVCSRCREKQAKNDKKRKEEYENFNLNNSGQKACGLCGKIFPVEVFLGARGGIVKKCRICREKEKAYAEGNREKIKQRSAKWREENHNKLLENKKIYRDANRIKIKEDCKVWRENNKEKICRRNSIYRDKNKEKIKERKKEYYENNYDKISAYMKEYHKNNREEVKIKRKDGYLKNRRKILAQMREFRRSFGKFSVYHKKLTIEEKPICGESGELLVQCAYCRRYFPPTIASIQNRIQSLKGNMPGENRLYCSEECKRLCTVFKVTTDIYAVAEKVERNASWSKKVKRRANWECERCGAKKALEAHHEIPLKINSSLNKEMDNGICLCRDCHKKAHSQEGCTLEYLRRM